MSNKRKTKIVCTLGPAMESEKVLRKLVKAGMDFIRINLSHASADYTLKIIKKIKGITDIPIIFDTQGLEVRTKFKGGHRFKVKRGSEIKIYKKTVKGNSRQFGVTQPLALDSLEVGERVSINSDDLIVLKVLKKQKDFITVLVVEDGVLKNRATLSIENYDRDMPLTKRDKKVVEIMKNNNLRHLALSFVNHSQNIEAIRKEYGDYPEITAKIENKQALDRLEEIIPLADFIMVDRGDLSAGIGLENLKKAQEQVIKEGHRHNKPVFVATDILKSMAWKSRPTKEEKEDVINLLNQKVFGLVLARETAVGKHPVRTLKRLSKLCKKFEKI